MIFIVLREASAPKATPGHANVITCTIFKTSRKILNYLGLQVDNGGNTDVHGAK